MNMFAQGGGEYPPVLTVRETTDKPCVLVVEDDQTVAEVTRMILERRGYEVVMVDDGLSAIEAVRSNDFACIVLDLRMSVFDGEQLLDLLAFDKPGVLDSVIVVSGYKERAEKLRGKVREVFVKPIGRGLLEAAVARCVISGASKPAPLDLEEEQRARA